MTPPATADSTAAEKKPAASRRLQGIIPPMVTPLAADDRLDVAGLERLVEHILGGGAAGLFILGTTGEGPSLDRRLQYELIDRVVRQVRHRVPVLVGITHTSLVEAVATARHAAQSGVDAVVCSAPYYFPPTDAELLQFVRALNSQLPLPLYLYNMPGLTKASFAPSVVRELAHEPNIIGLKDSSGDLNYFQSVREAAADRPDWTLLVGPEHLLVDAVQFGADGGVCGGANIYPRLLVDLYEAAVRRDAEALDSIRKRLATLGQIYKLAESGGPTIVAIKYALSCLGICSEHLAPPLKPLSDPQRETVRRLIEQLGR